MYKDGYRHTLLEIQLASRPQLGTGDHVSVGPDLLNAALRRGASKAVCSAFTVIAPGYGQVLRASLGCKLLMRQLA